MGIKRARFALTVLLLSGATPGCGPTGTPAPASSENAASRSPSASISAEPPGPQPPVDATPSERAEPAGEGPRVRVEHLGRSPRRALRQQFASGMEQVQRIRGETQVVSADAHQTLTLEGRRTARILDVTQDGTARFSVEVGPLTLASKHSAGGSGAAVQSAAARARSNGAVDDRGVWLHHRVEVDASEPGALAATAKTLAQAPDPLPPEEVGLGAVWVATRALEDAGARVDQTTTYELLEANDSAFRARVVRIQQPADEREPATESRGEVFQQLGWLFPDEDLEQRSVATTLDGLEVEIRSRVQVRTQ